ncbi:MAG: hypothetical protein CMM08_03260 [Rhodospirillaceae bacterium]|nr:hypothetical protein [Rhodospirillaceae bacterium]
MSRQNRQLEREIARLHLTDSPTGGRGLAPCWEDADGRIVPTFNIVIGNKAFRAVPVWREPFTKRALAIAPLVEIADRPLNVRDFRRLAYRVMQHGRNHPDGACVYYANIIDRTTTKQACKSQRRLVEGYFYPFSLR